MIIYHEYPPMQKRNVLKFFTDMEYSLTASANALLRKCSFQRFARGLLRLHELRMAARVQQLLHLLGRQLLQLLLQRLHFASPFLLFCALLNNKLKEKSKQTRKDQIKHSIDFKGGRWQTQK